MKHLFPLLAACTFLATGCSALSQTNNSSNSLKPPNPAVAQWAQFIPAIKAALPAHSVCPADNPVVVDAAQFGARGLSVALVRACNGSKNSDPLVVMRFKDGRPVLTEFRDASGNQVVPEFARNDSARKRLDVQLIPHSNAIVITSQSTNEHNQEMGCGADVYTWNSHTQAFDWNARQTNKAYGRYCAN